MTGIPGLASRTLTEVRSRLRGPGVEAAQSPWLSDAPQRLDEGSDAFGVEGLVDRLARTIASARPPFTLSLSGTWGVGKSTVALAVVERLRADGVPAVLIDAWTEDVSTLRRTIVVAVGAALRHPDDVGVQTT